MDLWEMFITDLEGLFHHMEVIVQLRVKVLQMTTLLKEYIYPLSDRKAQKRIKDARFADQLLREVC